MGRTSSSSYWSTVIDRHQCDGCGSHYNNKRELELHSTTCQGNAKPFVCPECPTAFKKNSNLAKHMRLVHRGEKNFACTEPGCDRKFGQKSNLNSHVKAVHLGEKPYVCEEQGCTRKFSQKSGLKAHIKTVHHHERPYKCHCGSSFGHRGDVSVVPSTFRVASIFRFSLKFASCITLLTLCTSTKMFSSLASYLFEHIGEFCGDSGS